MQSSDLIQISSVLLCVCSVSVFVYIKFYTIVPPV